MRVLVCSSATLTDDGYVANLGDEGVTEMLVSALRERLPSAEIRATLNTRAAADRALPAGRVCVRPVRELARSIQRADYVVIGGGTLLQEDVPAGGPMLVRGLLRYLTFVASVCVLCRRRYGLAAVGAESLVDRRARFVVRRLVLGADYVSVRDQASARLVSAIAGTDAVVGADPVLLHHPPTVDSRKVDAAVNATVAELGDAARVGGALRLGTGAEARLIGVATDNRHGQDRVAVRAILDAADPERTRILDRSTTWRETCEVIGGARVAVGARLHFLIFSVVAGTPAISISQLPKALSFAEDAGIPSVRVDSRPGEAALAAAISAARQVDVGRIAALRRRSAAVVDDLASRIGGAT